MSTTLPKSKKNLYDSLWRNRNWIYWSEEQICSESIWAQSLLTCWLSYQAGPMMKRIQGCASFSRRRSSGFLICLNKTYPWRQPCWLPRARTKRPMGTSLHHLTPVVVPWSRVIMIVDSQFFHVPESKKTYFW